MLRVLLQRFFPCLRSPTRSALTPNDGAELHSYDDARTGSVDSVDEHAPTHNSHLPAPHRLSGAMNTRKLSASGIEGARGLVIYPRQAGLLR